MPRGGGFSGGRGGVGGFDRRGGGRGGPQKRGGGMYGAGGPPKRPRFDAPPVVPSNGYVPQPPAPAYGAGNGYGAVAGQPPVSSYGGGYAQGYAQPYQGYESYQQPPDYSQQQVCPR